MPTLHKLSQEQLAKVLAGVDTIEIPDAPPATSASAAPAAQGGLGATTPDAVAAAAALAGAPAPAPAPAATPAPPAAAAAAAAAAPTQDSTAMAASLVAQASRVGELSAEVATLKAAATKSEGLVPKLLAIVQASCGTMQVALGQSDTSKNLDAEGAITQHAALVTAFMSKFPAGGVAATPAGAAAATAQTAADTQAFRARLHAARGMAAAK